MGLRYFLSLIITYNLLMYCGSAVVHSHSIDHQEREVDGSYRGRDADHNTMHGHKTDFDHEAILGSVQEAEEYDQLSPDEAKTRLSALLPKMDLNSDGFVDRLELKKWILNSFLKLSREEVAERIKEVDENHDGVVDWQEYLQDVYGVETEDLILPEDTGESGMLLHEEKDMWRAADIDGDGLLNLAEFEVFINPEEHPEMHPFLVSQALREKDTDADGKISFNEFVGEKGVQQDKAWLLSEKDKFDNELDTDGDGALDAAEIKVWVAPDNEEIAEEEVSHLFASADDDGDDLLSYKEIVDHHHVFVGSDEDTQYQTHFDDEL